MKSAAKRPPLAPIQSHECPAGHTFENGETERRNAVQDGLVVTTETGEQYFIIGKNRIKITEHFSPDGKQIDELVTDFVIHKMKEKAGKIA